MIQGILNQTVLLLGLALAILNPLEQRHRGYLCP